MKRKIHCCLLLLFLPTISFGLTWTSNLAIGHSYFAGHNSYSRISLAMGSDFNTCGTNNWGMIQQNDVGDMSYKMLVAVVLTAITLEKQVSLLIDGCIGGRAKILGLRLSQ